MSDCCIILVTADKKAVLEDMAKTLLEKKWAACIQIAGPIDSHYTWEGQIESTQEYTGQIKTQTKHFEAINTFIEENHPYDTPEIIQIPIQNGNPTYLTWLKENTP